MAISPHCTSGWLEEAAVEEAAVEETAEADAEVALPVLDPLPVPAGALACRIVLAT